MFGTGSMQDHWRRVFLILFLILLLIGLSEHLMMPTGGMHHVLTESTCAVHQGVNLPAGVQVSCNESAISPEPKQDNACTLELVAKIPHPPTV